MKVMDYTGLSDAKFVGYSLSGTHWICQGCEGDEHWTVRCWSQLLHTRFTSIAWSIALELMLLGQVDLVRSLRFLQHEQNFLNHLLAELHSAFYTTNVFGCSCGVIAQFKLVKPKFSNQTTLYFHLCVFQITHRVKQYAVCQCTNNYNGNLPQLELFQSHDISAAN